MFELSCEFSVIHQHPLGWTNDGNKSDWRGGEANKKWLYNQDMAESSPSPAKAGGTEERVEAAVGEVLDGGLS